MNEVCNEILVSVIMPTYNTSERYLREAIESILHQTYSCFEFLITVDGSTNHDLSVAREFEAIDHRVKVIDNGCNKGLVYSLNNMIMMSKGKYIFRMDSDDVSFPKRLEKMVNFLERNPDIDICGSQVRYLQSNKKTRRTFLPCSDQEIKSWLVFSNPLAHPSVVFRRDSLFAKNLKYSSSEKSEDYNLWVECSNKGLTFSNYREPLLFYRIHDKQTISVYKTELSESGMRIRERYLRNLNIKISEDLLLLITRFAQRPDSLEKPELVLISQTMEMISNTFEDKLMVKKMYASMFTKKVITMRRKKKLEGKERLTDYSIMRFASIFDKCAVRLCLTI